MKEARGWERDTLSWEIPLHDLAAGPGEAERSFFSGLGRGGLAHDLGCKPLLSLPRPLSRSLAELPGLHTSGPGTDGLQLVALLQLCAQVTQASAHSSNKLRETTHHLIHFYPIKNHPSQHLSRLLGLGDEKGESQHSAQLPVP